ncbi:MAG: hypothetical protein V4591_10710, partial [Bdellovibrionota bacterium]
FSRNTQGNTADYRKIFVEKVVQKVLEWKKQHPKTTLRIASLGSFRLSQECILLAHLLKKIPSLEIEFDFVDPFYSDTYNPVGKSFAAARDNTLSDFIQLVNLGLGFEITPRKTKIATDLCQNMNSIIQQLEEQGHRFVPTSNKLSPYFFIDIECYAQHIKTHRAEPHIIIDIDLLGERLIKEGIESTKEKLSIQSLESIKTFSPNGTVLINCFISAGHGVIDVTKRQDNGSWSETKLKYTPLPTH